MEILENKDEWDAIKSRYLVAGDRGDERLNDQAFSKVLFHYKIAHLGVMKTGHPYELTRVKQNGSCFIATISGEGKVLLDGNWHTIPVGKACLLPPFIDNSIKTTGSDWEFVWVKYLEHEEEKPVVTSLSPVIDNYNPATFVHACMGLYKTCSEVPNLALENLWVELIHKHVLLFAQSKVEDERLWKLWQTIESNLAKDWTLTDMTTLAHISSEHLRRLCKKEFGRSPMKQLTYMRIRKARYLLTTTRSKVSTIASQVGYKDEFHFSNAFFKNTGTRPSRYRSID